MKTKWPETDGPFYPNPIFICKKCSSTKGNWIYSPGINVAGIRCSECNFITAVFRSWRDELRGRREAGTYEEWVENYEAREDYPIHVIEDMLNCLLQGHEEIRVPENAKMG